MEQFTVIRDILLILSVSLPIIYLFKKLKISSVIGFLATGVIIGPSGLNLIGQNSEIDVMAELGIILLMFSIGLEMSIKKLLKMKSMLLYFGTLQVLLTTAVITYVCCLVQVPLKQAVFWGMLVSLSSTAIVLKIYREKGMLDAPHGRITLSILIFQDIAIIPMLLVLPVLAGGETFSAMQFVQQIGKSLLFIGVIIAFSYFVVPKILYGISRLRTRELFTVTMVVILFGTAYVTHSIGISFSIGAFIAGFVIAESDFSHEIEAEVTPFRDIFNSLFFVSIGLLLNLSRFIGQISLTLVIAGMILVLKALIIYFIVRIRKFPTRTAIITALSIFQVGEFSFVLAQTGFLTNIINADMYNLFLGVAICTMIITPLCIEFAPGIARLLKLPEIKDESDDEKIILSGHVIVAGFGLNGKNLSSVLKEAGIPYCVLELNPDTIKKAKAAGENIMYGDITRQDILMKLSIDSAKVIVYAISDPQSTKASLQLVKRLNPEIYTMVRTRYVAEVDELIKLGADEVIPEEFETSLQMFSRVLQRYHIPMNMIARQINILRQGSYEMLRHDSVSIPANYLNDLLMQGVTESFFIEENSPVKDKSIKEINLRAKTGATILAIVRQEKSITNPKGDEVLLYGDILVLTGTHQAVDDAINLLTIEEL
jgi:CPA2 family monovalent cation:H+ antiporter-2